MGRSQIVRSTILIMSVVFLSSSISHANEVVKILAQMAQKMTRTLQVDLGTGTVIAVMPFSTEDRRLEKAKMGNVISEILTHHLVKERKFEVVERVQLESILREQGLSLTGAVDEKSAIQVGTLMGASILVLGSIQKISGEYQVNARMVDVGSGKILTTDFAAIPAETFEEIAPPVKSFMPDRQIIGIYGSYMMWGVKADVLPNISVNQNSYNPPVAYNVDIKQLPGSEKSLFNYPGIGLRYYPLPWLFIDGNANFTNVKIKLKYQLSSNPDFVEYKNGMELGIENPFNISVNYSKNFRKRFYAVVGAGASYVRTSFSPELQGNFKLSNTNLFLDVVQAKQNDIFWIPFFRAGCEFRPQERVGISIFANYLATRKTVVYDHILKSNNITNPLLPALKVEFGNEFNFTTTVSLYF